MRAFVKERGPVAAFPLANVNTDMIMPKQFLKRIDRDGLSQGLFHDLRFDEHGYERSDFVLNQPETRQPEFLIVGPNFGCGSSREHAVWGLIKYGFRGLIGISYGDIFFDNCGRNGLLAISLNEEQHSRLLAFALTRPGHSIAVDLVAQIIQFGDDELGFRIDQAHRENLINGSDLIGRTLAKSAKIETFEQQYFKYKNWLR